MMNVVSLATGPMVGECIGHCRTAFAKIEPEAGDDHGNSNKCNGYCNRHCPISFISNSVAP